MLPKKGSPIGTTRERLESVEELRLKIEKLLKAKES